MTTDTRPFCDVCKKPVDVVRDITPEVYKASGVTVDPREIYVECHNVRILLAAQVGLSLEGYHLFGIHGDYYHPPGTPPMSDAEIERKARKPVDATMFKGSKWEGKEGKT